MIEEDEVEVAWGVGVGVGVGGGGGEGREVDSSEETTGLISVSLSPQHLSPLRPPPPPPPPSVSHSPGIAKYSLIPNSSIL